MKIGIFDPYLDDLGGGEKYMMSLALCLSKDHDVSIFWDNRQDLKKLEERFLFDLSKIKLIKNIFSKKINFLTRLLATRNFDVIIFLSDGSIPFVLSKKLFIHIQEPLHGFSINSFKIKIKLSKINAFFFNSNYTKSFVNQKINSLVIYPPVELFLKEVKKENIILHVGRFRVRNVKNEDFKKQMVMVKKFKQMVENGLKEWHFVLAVSIQEKDKREFEDLIRESKGFPIEFLINNNNKKLWDIYNKSKIYWHASGYGENLLEHPEYAEHFGISTVEAMGAGVVPIVINAGGQKEIVQNKVNGFLWNTLDELENRTRELIENENLLEKMSKLAKERARKFAGDRFCREISNLIENY